MITSILYLQRERSLVVSGILIAQPPAAMYIRTFVYACLIYAFYRWNLWVRGEQSSRTEEKEKKKSYARKREKEEGGRGSERTVDVSPRKSPKVVNEAKVT